MAKTTLGIIGGTGLYELDGLEHVSTENVVTPFGEPSSEVTVGYLGDVKLLFIARHGAGHRILPSELNFRANIWALKKLGAEWCLSLSAVGSLKEECAPGDFVVPDQIIDRTNGRVQTFFGEGMVAHVAFADPFCPTLRELVGSAAEEVFSGADHKVHGGGTYLCINGPTFSTRAESNLFRSWGASIIGMTNMPEARLAREAELAYATLGLVTDYDCWRSPDADVDINDILSTMKENVVHAKQVVHVLAPLLTVSKPSALAAEALTHAIITPKELIPQAKREQLAPILPRHF